MAYAELRPGDRMHSRGGARMGLSGLLLCVALNAWLGVSATLASPYGHDVARAGAANNADVSCIKPHSQPDGGASTSRPGIHATQQELEIWCRRAVGGPYKRSGDAQENSPGDWARIKQNAAAFVANPGADRWDGGYAGAGCVPKKSRQAHGKLLKIRDAALVYRVSGDGRYSDAVRRELLDFYVVNSRIDFSDRTRWCLGAGALNDVGPSFSIAEAMSRAIAAYDFVRDDLSQPDRDKLDAWFRSAGDYFRQAVDDDLGKLFANRERGLLRDPDRWSRPLPSFPSSRTHHDGYEIPGIAAYYNNRRAAMVHFVAEAGVLLNDRAMIDSAELFFKEWLRYSVFPDGTHAEYYRSSTHAHEIGFAYSLSTIYHMIVVADVLARSGRVGLYEFITSEGLAQTKGGSKSLLLALRNVCKYLDGTFARYLPGKHGDEAFRIDGVDGDWVSVFDIYLSRANVYYRDPYIRSVYLRTRPGTRPYPRNPASAGPYPAWQGTGGTSPGVLFMHGQLEGEVWPYPVP